MLSYEKNFSGYLDKNMSSAIKGLALILMIIHHCFGFPTWYIEGIDYSYISIFGESLDKWIAMPTKICVSIFAFLTGWSYYFNRSKTIRYSLKKIINLLFNYWFILFIIFLPLSIYGGYKPTFTKILLNMFALKDNLVTFAWYVYFYIFVMLALPFVANFLSGKGWLDFTFLIASCVFARNILSQIQIPRQYLISNLSNCFSFVQCVIIGYIFANHNLFDWLYKYFYNKNKIQFALIALFAMGSRLKWNYFLGINLDILYSPIIIFAFMVLLIDTKTNIPKQILEFMGRHSLNIWFLHSIFFNSYTKVFFQRIAYIPKNPILVVIWVILLCIPISMLINLIINKIKYLYSIAISKIKVQYNN